MSDSGITKECCGASAGHDRACPQLKRELVDEILAEAVEITLKNGKKLILHKDGYWFGLADVQTKIRYRFIGDAYSLLKPMKISAPAGGHFCHFPGCETEVAPRYLMCPRHWKLVPKDLQQEVYRHYRAGQEKDKKPSRKYLDAANKAIKAVMEILGDKTGAPEMTDEPREPTLFD